MTEAPNASADLTDAEIDRICDGLKQSAAKVRYLREVLNLEVRRTPSGRPLVNRKHYDAVKGGAQASQSAGAPSGGIQWGVR
jgi:hypothetical protein